MDEFRIITGSSADLNEEMKAELNAEEPVPFYLHIADEIITDDDTLSVPVLIDKMKACTEKMASSCADPETWKNAFTKAKKAFAITLSTSLSGAYTSACAGLKMAIEESGCEGHVFDTMSAVSGETLVAYKVRECVQQGLPMNEIIEKVEAYIKKMKTFFVLDDISNLIKNGRLSHIKGTIIQVLNIKPILGERDGRIELFSKVRGYKNIADKMVSMISLSGREIDGDNFLISHCNNLSLAQEIVDKAKAKFNFGKMRIVEMKGVSTFYACDKGVCMSF